MYAKNIWLDADQAKEKKIHDFGEDYKAFLSYGKTERLVVEEAIQMAEKEGFKPLSSCKELKPGDKVYATNKGKNFLAAVIGKKSLEEGSRILGAHIDSPRLDIKQNPLYEKVGK